MKYATALIALLTLVACGLDVKNPSGKTANSGGPVLGPGPTPSPTPGAPSVGETVYLNRCATCHSLGTFDTTTSAGAPNLKGTTKVDSTGYFPTGGAVGHQGITLTTAEISAVKSFIASK